MSVSTHTRRPPAVLRDSGKPIPVGEHNRLHISDCRLRIGCCQSLEITPTRQRSPVKLNQK